MRNASLLPALLGLFLCSGFAAQAEAPSSAPRHWEASEIRMVTAERIAALPKEEQPAWFAYLERSQANARRLPTANAPDFTPDKPVTAVPHSGATKARGLRLSEREAWYAGEEARLIADRVARYQNAAGGWTKGNNYDAEPQPKATRSLWDNGTIDNDATSHEMEFLLRVISHAPEDARSTALKESFRRGLRYLFDAQYPNGGFPQVYPLGHAYNDAVTFNDDAMVQVLRLLAKAAGGDKACAFLSESERAEAARHFRLGVACVLACQIREPGGRLTAWCQQHDPLTLKPCPARNFEPAACCAAESCGIVAFLMSLPNPSPEILASTDAAVAWLKSVPVKGLQWNGRRNDGIPQETPGAPLLWARFYELGTDRPIFGDRDRSIHYSVAELSPERRHGYGWYGGWPAGLLADYPAWRTRQ
jgi:PelA/Pel-15E family pectate lyase